MNRVLETYGTPTGWVIYALEESQKERREKIFEEITPENSSSLMKDMTINIQEAQWTPGKVNSKRPTPRHIIIEVLEDKYKDKGKILKTAREKWLITYTRSSIRLLAYFLLEILEVVREFFRVKWKAGYLKISIKVYIWVIIKAPIVIMVCNSTFCFLHC